MPIDLFDQLQLRQILDQPLASDGASSSGAKHLAATFMSNHFNNTANIDPNTETTPSAPSNPTNYGPFGMAPSPGYLDTTSNYRMIPGPNINYLQSLPPSQGGESPPSGVKHWVANFLSNHFNNVTNTDPNRGIDPASGTGFF